MGFLNNLARKLEENTCSESLLNYKNNSPLWKEYTEDLYKKIIEREN